MMHEPSDPRNLPGPQLFRDWDGVAHIRCPQGDPRDAHGLCEADDLIDEAPDDAPRCSACLRLHLAGRRDCGAQYAGSES